MKIFNTVAIEISSQCNRNCKFCPNAYNERPDELIDFSLLVKAAKELREINYKGRIELYIYNEPLKHKKWFLKCLKYLRETVPKSCLMIATNGDYLHSGNEIIELFDLGLNQLLINCYSKGLFVKRQFWIDSLPVNVSREKSVYTVASSKSKTIQILDKSLPETFGKGVFRLVNRAGNLPNIELKTPLEKMCVKPFRFLNITWKGNALVCCQDYHERVSYGSLENRTLLELWNHPVMNEYRKRLLKKDRSLPLCCKCDCYAGAYTHNVDTSVGVCDSKKKIEQLAKRKSPA